MDLSPRTIDRRIARFFSRHAHRAHRVSLGLLFIWFGLLKPFGLKTTTSLLAHTIWLGDPDFMVQVLGWWEVAIGACLIVRPLVRLAIVLLAVRLPGTLLAFIIHPSICFEAFPLAPTPEGQYLIKDLAVFFATLAIAASVHEPSTAERRH